MKNIFIVLTMLFSIVACNETAKQPAVENSDSSASDSSVMTIQIPKSNCYRSISKRDTVSLKVETFPNVVTGTLVYNLYEKDKNTGEIDGVMKGDTLLANYSFMSEGSRSVRQVIFLIKDGVATEGYGEMEERKDTMVFKNASTIDFSKGTKMEKVSCVEGE